MALQTQVSLNGALGSLLAFDLVVSLYINLRLDAMAFRVNVSLSAWKPRAQDSAADLGASSPVVPPLRGCARCSPTRTPLLSCLQPTSSPTVPPARTRAPALTQARPTRQRAATLCIHAQCLTRVLCARFFRPRPHRQGRCRLATSPHRASSSHRTAWTRSDQHGANQVLCPRRPPDLLCGAQGCGRARVLEYA